MVICFIQLLSKHMGVPTPERRYGKARVHKTRQNLKQGAFA